MIPLFKVHMAESAAHDVGEVLRSGFIGQGPVVDSFTGYLSRYTPGYPVLTNSCTSAIHLALSHIGVGPGDEVITTPMTCVATNAPILSLGAKIVWADVDPETGLIDDKDVAWKVTGRTKAIIGVDWTGRRAPYRWLRRNGVPVIQDAAHGPLIRKPVFYCGDYVCYSFGPIKHFTTGEGGAVVMPRGSAREVADLVLMRWYGLDRTSKKDFRCDQNIARAGLKWHMTDVNAAIGQANLGFLAGVVGRHQENAGYLYGNISNPVVKMPRFDHESNYWVFPVLLPTREIRDAFRAWMESRGVACSQVHARNDHHDAYRTGAVLPGVDSFDARQANIPCGWWLTTEDVAAIARAVNEFVP